MNHSASHSEKPEVTPFWQRLPLFFRYPLHIEPLLYMAVLATATLLGFILPVPAPFGHLLVLFGVWLAFIRYAYKTLDQTAQGRLRPDQHESHSDKDRANLPYKQFAILVVTGFALVFAARLGGLIFGAALIFSVLTLPASVMILSITRSFWAGLNPLAAIGMMRVIGMPYLGLCAFLFLLSASQGFLQSSLLPRLPVWSLLPALNFVAMYFTLIMFNMMGYVVYQHHHLLGVPVVAGDAPGTKGSERGGDAEAIGRLIGAGQIDAALELAYEAQRVAPDDAAAHGRYHKLLALAGRNERLASHAKPYLTLLLNKGQGDEALQIFRGMRERDPSFVPEQPAQLLRLAEAARRRREFPEALALVKGFDKRFPGHAEIPAVYLFAARVLCENLRQDASARQILAALLARYPEHAVSAEARQLLAAIDKLAAPPAAH